ncbi:MAG: hypothetical protein C0412_08190, partial [Flavobacterium sp.]|nr:hypothetical protein [Flavobacterium sp.]
MILTKENIKSFDADGVINETISAGRLKELLVVVPTNRKLRDYKKEIISKCSDKGITALNLETFESLCGNILEVSKVFIKLSEAASSVLLSHSVSETKLKYFSSFNGDIPKGTLNRIRNVISEYKRHGITPQKLRIESEKLSYSERLKAEDIADVYENFSVRTTSLRAYETGDIYSGLVSMALTDFENNFRSVFPDIKQIIIKGFDEFSELEVTIIDLLSQIADCGLFLQFDYTDSNPGIFSHLDKSYQKLDSKGFKRIEEKGIIHNSGFKEIIKEKLFSERKYKKIDKFKHNIFGITSYNREEEIINIAKEVKRLILKERIEPHKICVAFNLVQSYSPIVAEIFTVYGIPHNLTDRVFLEYTAPIIAILNLLEIMENDFYYKNIIRAFSSNIISKEGIELKSIIKSAIDLKIVGGRENWISSLKNAIEERRGYLKDNDFKDEEIKTYKSALNSIYEIQKILKPFEEKLTISEFLEKMELTIYNLRIPYHILDYSAEKEKEIKAVTTLIETLKEVFNLLIMQYGEEKKFSIIFFLDQIRTAASHARFNVKEKSDSALLVTSLEEIRGLEFDYLFIGGLCDGDFPTKYQPEIFFSGSFQKQEEVHLAEERHLFYQSLSAWNINLFLSHPMNESNKELNESSFLKEFCRLFEITEIEKEYFANKIYSKEEIQKILGASGKELRDNLLLPELVNNNFDEKYYHHALNVQDARFSIENVESVYSGYIRSEENIVDCNSLQKIDEQFEVMKNKQYSISQLETYAKCPFKFFVERVISVEPEEEPTEEIEAIEMGNLLHTVFFEFFSFLRDNKILLSKCTEADFIKAKKKLFEIAEKKIEEMPFFSPLSFYEREKVLGINRDETKSILYKLLMYEREENSSFEPKYFETPFGNVEKETSDSSLNESRYIEMNGVKLKGKIDRIEINKEENSFRVIDYKLSGKRPTKDELWQGISLQLPVYLAAAEQILFNTFNE